MVCQGPGSILDFPEQALIIADDQAGQLSQVLEF